jgi:NAD(P)-dependent dehydrogenase (short-subunit alcohol dehydrogenase family)
MDASQDGASATAAPTGSATGFQAPTTPLGPRFVVPFAITYLPQEEVDAQNIARIITESGRKAVMIPGDLSDAALCTEVVEGAAGELGGLDIMVNNAGKQIAVENLEDLPDEQIEETFRTNILAMFRMTKAALKHLQAGATIINTTSIQAYEPSPTLLDYASTKAAINNFTKGLAQQVVTQRNAQRLGLTSGADADPRHPDDSGRDPDARIGGSSRSTRASRGSPSSLPSRARIRSRRERQRHRECADRAA